MCMVASARELARSDLLDHSRGAEGRDQRSGNKTKFCIIHSVSFKSLAEYPRRRACVSNPLELRPMSVEITA